MQSFPPATHLYPPYKEVDTLTYAGRMGLLGLSAGTFSAAMKNAYFSSTTSAWGVLTLYGSTIPIYGAAVGSYGLMKAAMTNFRRTNDGWNELAGGLTGGFVWGLFRGHKLSNIIAVSVFSGTTLGLFSWGGGLGGLASIAGAPLQEAIEYRKAWQYYPTSLVPLEDYERAIGRKAYPEDFADINAIMGTERVAVATDVVDYHPRVPGAVPRKKWWKEVIEKTNKETESSSKK